MAINRKDLTTSSSSEARFVYTLRVAHKTAATSLAGCLNPWVVTGLVDAALLKKVAGINQFSTKRSCSNNLSLVVWGENLPSTVGTGRFTKKEREMIKLPPYQKSVIVGLIFSDGWLRFPSKTSKSANLGFMQSLAHSDYIWFVFSILPAPRVIYLYIVWKRGETNHIEVLKL